MENEVLDPEKDNNDIDVDMLGNRVRLMPTNSLQTQFDTFAVKQAGPTMHIIGRETALEQLSQETECRKNTGFVGFVHVLSNSMMFSIYFFDANLVPGCTQSLSLVCTLPSHQACKK